MSGTLDLKLEDMADIISKGMETVQNFRAEVAELTNAYRTQKQRADNAMAEVAELHKAIHLHHETFPDEPMEGERVLWKTVGIELWYDKHGLYKLDQIPDGARK